MPAHGKERVGVSGSVFPLVSPAHLRVRPMGVRRTCRWAGGIELTFPIGVELNGPLPRTALLAKKSGNIFRVGIFLDFVWLATRTMHPHGAYVRRARRNRIDRRGGEIERLGTRTSSQSSTCGPWSDEKKTSVLFEAPAASTADMTSPTAQSISRIWSPKMPFLDVLEKGVPVNMDTWHCGNGMYLARAFPMTDYRFTDYRPSGSCVAASAMLVCSSARAMRHATHPWGVRGDGLTEARIFPPKRFFCSGVAAPFRVLHDTRRRGAWRWWRRR